MHATTLATVDVVRRAAVAAAWLASSTLRWHVERAILIVKRSVATGPVTWVWAQQFHFIFSFYFVINIGCNVKTLEGSDLIFGKYLLL